MIKHATTALVCCVVFAFDASAQREPDVVVELRPSDDAPAASVQLRGLLSDSRYLRAMRSGFPLYVEYQVELRRSRSNWFDDVVAQTFWEYVVLYDPVRETFVVEDGESREELSNEQELRRRLETVWALQLTPERAGRYYYAATVSVRTLSDSDVDEVFDWLKGEDDSRGARRHGFITRGARKLLVRIAPLPHIRKSGESRKFMWP